jgi:hypothetical protein
MQALCKASDTANDVRCNICGQGFSVYFTRTSAKERADARHQIQLVLRDQHLATDAPHAHPATGFNVPEWSGDIKFSAAALIGNAPTWAVS